MMLRTALESLDTGSDLKTGTVQHLQHPNDSKEEKKKQDVMRNDQHP